MPISGIPYLQHLGLDGGRKRINNFNLLSHRTSMRSAMKYLADYVDKFENYANFKDVV